ncbi:DUF1624 domain-containing protein [Catenovulum sp. SM1970]|uniref:heparan-alpha-glucosaminide N-acetyltransferase domain-containing protein n=1 Tax=Marinifaba aquimaris TaxID=2741323 RepID=UPI001572C46D|nr:heparan-alpha-glucosaminide N-acetyltransferase domain-containing protein [Marinifaba aquimaris]NTS78840.1 DUF1624 domain-containing protein [Marinifaba aquimaris]
MSSHSPSPTQRIAGFDLARGLAVFFMILIHVLHFYAIKPVWVTNFGTIIEYLGEWPAAPVFIFIMGVFLIYGNKQTFSQGMKRAFMLFALGYLLNFARGTAPMWLSLEMELVTLEQLGGYTPMTEFLVIDIFQYAALAYAIGLVLKHTLPNQPWLWIALATIIAFASPYVWDFETGMPVVDELTKFLWGHYHYGTAFPLFPWLAYPLVGMAFGHWLSKPDAQSNLFGRSFVIGCAVLLTGVTITISNYDYHIAHPLRTGPGSVVMITGFVLIWLSVCRYITLHVPNNPIFNLLYFWSKHVTTIYVVQWILIGWGLMLVGSQQLNLSQTIASMITLVVLSDLVTRAWLKAKNFQFNRNTVITQ